MAPQVVLLRSLRAHDTLEMQRMVTEKVFAFWESMGAMGLAAMSEAWSPWTTPWQTMTVASKVLEQGMRPIHRRVFANARRLRLRPAMRRRR